MVNSNGQSQQVGKALLQRQRIRILDGPRRPIDRLSGGLSLGNALDIADGQALVNHPAGNQFGIGHGKKRARVASRHFTLLDAGADRVGQTAETQGVRHVAPALSDHSGHIGLRITKLGNQIFIATGFLKRIQIGPLDVLDNGKLERLTIVRLDNNDRNIVQSGPLCGTPAALAGDDLERIDAANHRPDHNGLDDVALADRGRQFLQIAFGKMLPRIERIGPQELDGQATLRTMARFGLIFRANVAEKGGKPPTQTRLSCIFSHLRRLF